MNDLEQARYNEALKGLSAAFFQAYEKARQDTPSQLNERDIDETFPVPVPRRDIRDGMWGNYVPLFQEAGREAARLAARIGREITLVPPTNYLSGAFDNEDTTWHVMVAGKD